ncbi:hypothetical protein LIER_31982 [Lithospermum erythrorhizon]|uniref:Uncharacterized protein n=1 Tax=Lithospermum erythrorhizon TaxID=34254 RepID=A0AAV3RUS9_LITER
MTFTREDVTRGLFSIKMGKAPGPDDDTILFGEVTEGETRSIMSILHHYGLLSGQLVSIQKSTVMLSPNLRADTRAAISYIQELRWSPHMAPI